MLTSCGDFDNSSTKLSLDDKASWALGKEYDDVAIAANYNYMPLELGFCNLSDILGYEKNYVWVKFTFSLTDELKNQSLGLVIPYVHFSEKTWINGNNIGQMGDSENDPHSSLLSSYSYFISPEFLRQNGKNEILMKILCQGRSSISKGVFLDTYNNAKIASEWMNFLHSRIYMIFDGILISSFIFFLILYFANKKDLSVLYFSYICACSSVFLVYMFGAEVPFYASGMLSHLTFAKVFLCSFTYLSIYCTVSFILSFISLRIPFWITVLRQLVLYVTIIITLAAPDYNALIRLFVPMLTIYLLQFITAEVFVIKAFFNKNVRTRAIIVHVGFLPMIISMVSDVIVRDLMGNISNPYFSIFGFQITIAFFVVYLSTRYNKTYLINEKLNRDLRQEVKNQTAGLRVVNNKLMQELDRSEKNLTMASIVQQKFFHKPEGIFQDWDMAMDYYPLSKVSGDLYDFFTTENQLDGVAIFDASGHGVAAALVTMLSKNIIYQAFNNSLIKKTKLSKAMEEVNDTFIDEKGEVENYLTGIMIRMNYINDEVCQVEMAIAGHPYPVLYSAETCDIVNLKNLVTDGPHYGAVGMSEMMVNYADITFNMKKNDILLCFTDGITEIKNEDHEDFGRARLETLVKEKNQSSSQEILSALSQRVQDFRGKIPREDDITAIVLKKN